MSGYSVVHTKEAPPVDQIPLSQAIKTPFAIFLSGQIPATPDGALVTGSITDKTRQIITNLRAVLTEAGSSIDKVVKIGKIDENVTDNSHGRKAGNALNIRQQARSSSLQNVKKHAAAKSTDAKRGDEKPRPQSIDQYRLFLLGMRHSLCTAR
ncbi:2-iminobutanoate/2-iminopropanoate deaminase like protein [Verticillium longisporum]|uniref:2-iminobutanoate/2-iminopropanoate deaminase like protein n=1 Tax=Verticillium longisporum TaxID=100787 RepID=A0A8I2Z740_VERLO|nr:2-iminobutanoate/2-iminopropanoate deaminase like protein [Verticillium longisporum]